MKKISYKIIIACIAFLCICSCDDKTKYLPLPEAVPLEMTINDKSFVMGEELIVDINIVQPKAEMDSEKNNDEASLEIKIETLVANEDFDIYFSAKSGTEDVSHVFESFTPIIVFPKGEKNIQAHFPIKSSGLDGTESFEFSAFSRGYKIKNSNFGMKVSDFYRVTVRIMNNSENVITEGENFVLEAIIDKAPKNDIEIKLNVKEEDKSRFISLPESIIIPAGRTSGKTDPITIDKDYKMTGNLNFSLGFESLSKMNPLTNSEISITMTDIESLADPKLFDMTEIYENPDLMFRSYDNPWFKQWTTEKMKPGNKHPNAELANEWTFDYAVECHDIPVYGNSVITKYGNATDCNKGATLKINRDKYSKISKDGELVIFIGTEGSSYGSSAIHLCKTGGKVWPQNFTRIYPGMRIEIKARFRGNRTGFVPMFELKNPGMCGRNPNQSICLMQNESGSTITQYVRGDNAGDVMSTSTGMPSVEEYNIYWAEFMDENTIRIGINGSMTLEVKSSDLKTWPFTKETTGKSVGYKGLFLLLRWELFGFGDTVSKDLPENWDKDLKSMDPSKYSSEGPRMEVDFIRFYTNKNYIRENDEVVNRNIPFY